MLNNIEESDEAYARRLQAQELGGFHNNVTPRADAQTPLVGVSDS
jgi:hypothetical protein